jgi:hypothetical protein
VKAFGCTVMCNNGVAFDMFRKKNPAYPSDSTQSEVAKNPTSSGYKLWLWFTASSYHALFPEGFSGMLMITDIGIFLELIALVVIHKKIEKQSSK